MTFFSCGYGEGFEQRERSEQREQREERERKLFIENLDLLLFSEPIILNDRDYFFTPLSFAWCSWPYVSGDGPLPLGYLLMGWRDKVLTEPCPNCDGEVLLNSFGGSPLSEAQSWSGVCKNCRVFQSSKKSAAARRREKSKAFHRGEGPVVPDCDKESNSTRRSEETAQQPLLRRFFYVQQLRMRFPERVSYWEEYDGHQFRWGGDGLRPARKWRLVCVPVATELSLDVLISELKSH